MQDPGYTKYIQRKKEPKGWRHFVRDTNVAVMEVVKRHEAGWAMEDIREAFPLLSVTEIQATLKYFYKYPQRFGRKPEPK